VQQLVQHSLDEDFPPAQRVQCLKLLGSLFEVGAFVERKEITTVKRSEDIRTRIIEALKDVTDVTPIDDGLSLLEEIKGSPDQPGETKAPQVADPTTQPPPQEGTPAGARTTHTNPHESSSTKSNPLEQPNENPSTLEDELSQEDPPLDDGSK
jgi:hypothetical protein